MTEAAQELPGKNENGAQLGVRLTEAAGEGGPLCQSLLYAAASFGRRVSAQTVMAGLPASNGLLTPELFGRAAAKAGLCSKCVKTGIESINRHLCPVILILKNGSCVLTAKDGGKLRAVFPEMSDAEREMQPEELEPDYAGYAIYVSPLTKADERVPGERPTEKERWFWDSLASEKALYKDVLLASFLSNIFAFAMPIFVMNVYNRVIPNTAIESMWVMAVGVFVMICADFALHLSRSWLTDRAAARTNKKLSAMMMEQVLDMRNEERPPSVGSMTNSIQGFDSVRSFISSATVFAYVDLPFALMFIAVTAIISWQLALPIIIGGILVLVQAVFIQREMRELSEKTNRASSLKNAALVESLVSIDSVKSQNLEHTMQERWERSVDELEDANVRMRLLSNSVISWTQWVNMTVSVVTMLLGVYLIRENAISMGSLIAAYMISSRAMAPIGRVAGLIMQYYSTQRSLSSLNDVMSKGTEHPGGKNYISISRLNGAIEFRGVSFAYPGQERLALDGVTFSVAPGEHVAVIGAVGSGKSTLLKLILGLYEPTEGRILLDGIDMQQADHAELRERIGAVPQDVALFYGTLRDNLIMGNPHTSDEMMLRAAMISGADAIAAASPKGWDTQAGERGANLSSGQRQAVAIARAVLKEPSVMLLDEPTSSMDTANENLIRHNLKIFTQGRTLLLVTHRTPLMDLADRVIVLSDGKIAADGPKEEVLAALRDGKIMGAKR